MTRHRMQMREMDQRDQNLVLIGMISCSMSNTEMTQLTKRREQTVELVIGFMENKFAEKHSNICMQLVKID
jgi:hypothetical protein